MILRPQAVTTVLAAALIGGVFAPALARAETGYEAWLRYAPITDKQKRALFDKLPAVVVSLGDSPMLRSARDELARGVQGMLGRKILPADKLPAESAIVLGTFAEVTKAFPSADKPPSLPDDGFCIRWLAIDGRTHLVITAPNDRGVLYGVFALLRTIGLEQPIADLDVREEPYAPVRFINHWDNLDGTIERGYAGKSIFWDAGHVTKDLDRVRDYARLLASVGINGCSLNNVNADSRVISPQMLPEVAQLADAFRPWGVRILVSLDFASPQKLGGLDTFDPLDPRAVEFWNKQIDELYRAVPDLAGCVLKADSEGRMGPSKYGRTHADAANVIAAALARHGGLLFYRGFVYDHKMDWRDTHNDRARAAYENFHKLDGQFADNALVQIKHGPIDFQVREPVSPLFAGLEKTNEAIELQVTQEYVGQQRHLVFLVPMWKEMLDFDMRVNGKTTPVKELVAGRTFKRPSGGFVAVANVGRDQNWLGHDLAMSNLFGFGRLAWNPDLTSQQIAEEWTRLTFGDNPKVVDTIVNMLLQSWHTYENYTGPLGAGTLTDIINVHYGPGIESSERNGWGQWHRADEHGIGMDRTVATGTGYIGQYPPQVSAMFESLEKCPEDLLLFMHHVPYTHELHSGKSVIQHIYDTHYQGAADAARFADSWRSLKGLIDDQRFQETLDRLTYQAGHAIVWRDAVCDWFAKSSGIADDQYRVGNHPNRIEAELMRLDGYEPLAVKPWETASGGKCASLSAARGHGGMSFTYDGQPGKFRLAVQYFDENDGTSKFRITVNDKPLDAWTADDTLPDNKPSGHTSTRRTTPAVALKAGDEIRIDAEADGGEHACVDYVEINAAD